MQTKWCRKQNKWEDIDGGRPSEKQKKHLGGFWKQKGRTEWGSVLL